MLLLLLAVLALLAWASIPGGATPVVELAVSERDQALSTHAPDDIDYLVPPGSAGHFPG